MPTFNRLPRFNKDLSKLSQDEQEVFKAAAGLFLQGLKQGTGRFHPSLRVHRIDSTEDVWSITWGDDARATFHYGDPIKDREPHIVWHRVGTHKIYRNP